MPGCGAIGDVDWSRLVCGLRGHVTYHPTEEPLRERLRVDTPAGEAWRCLRCGSYIVGPPHGSGPADEAPLVRRGRALRDLIIMRALAIERLVKGVLLGLGAYGVWRFRASKDTFGQAFERELKILQPVADQLGYHNLDDLAVVRWVREGVGLSERALLLIMVAVAAYSAIQLTEAVGLWLMQRWGEYFAVVATSAFIPLEVYELAHKITVTRVVILVLNVAAVAYIIISKRLFGVRGGKATYEAERHEASLLEVEVAASGAALNRYRESAKAPDRHVPV